MKELQKLPFSFQKKYFSKCGCCDKIREETITYELKLKFLNSFGDFNKKERRAYLLYYEPRFYCNFSENPRVIGENTGMGKEDFSELFEDLLQEITKER